MVTEDQRLHLQTTAEVQRLRNDIMAELGKLAGQGQLGNTNVAEHLKNLENPVALGIENTKRGKKRSKTRTSGYKQGDGNQIGQEDVELLSKMFDKLSDSMRLFPTAASTAWERYSLLKSLWYQGMQDRQQTVSSAYSKTLNWIFDGSVPESYKVPKPGFIEWLEHEDGIFWVHGKPGSGKSTLMKFFANHPKTKRHLERWAHYDRKRLVFASHFFWIAGGTLQRSQKGLLQTLLFNLLRDCPDLVPCVYPDHETTRYPADYEEWSFQELKEALIRLKLQTEVRICLFIDGLDEYDPDTHEGSYEDLIKTLVGISESPNIKICVSSRSWYVFNDAFNKGEGGEVSKWVVTLEDLNRPDIEAYVRSSFSDNKRFKDLSNRDLRYPALLEQIVQRSQGVFLWIFLVVRSLLKGLTFADRVSDLQKKLNRIPDDLNGYFEQILDSVDEFYLKETAEIFQIMLRSQSGVPLLAFSFFFEEDHDYAFKIQGWCPMESQEASYRCDETRRRLDGRCRGLVEEDTSPSRSTYGYGKVRFLHRTVRDFLENKAMERLFSRLDPQFDADVSAARSYVALIKTVPSTLDDGSMYSELFFHCRKYEVRTSKPLVDLLEEARAVEQVRVVDTEILRSAAGSHLWLYLLRVVETEPGLNEKIRIKLLGQALGGWFDKDETIEAHFFRKDFIEGLLRKRTSPNEMGPYPETTWENFLHLLESQEISGAANKNDVFETAKAFIVHGAHTVRKDEVKIILEAEDALPLEQRKELAELLRSHRRDDLTTTERLSKSVQKLFNKVLKKSGLNHV